MEFLEAKELIAQTQNPVEELFGKWAGEKSLIQALLESRPEELRREEGKLCK